MRHFAMTGIVTASWISLTFSGSAILATPPSRRMSAGTRSSAITATAPASSAIRACSASITSMITPPFSISASPVLTRIVRVSCMGLSLAGEERVDGAPERLRLLEVEHVARALHDDDLGRGNTLRDQARRRRAADEVVCAGDHERRSFDARQVLPQVERLRVEHLQRSGVRPVGEALDGGAMALVPARE